LAHSLSGPRRTRSVTERIATDTLRGGNGETRKVVGADHERRYHQRGRTTKPATHLEGVWFALRDSLPRCHCSGKAEDVLASGLRLFCRSAFTKLRVDKFVPPKSLIGKAEQRKGVRRRAFGWSE
jgi:hypothetical protein